MASSTRDTSQTVAHSINIMASSTHNASHSVAHAVPSPAAHPVEMASDQDALPSGLTFLHSHLPDVLRYFLLIDDNWKAWRAKFSDHSSLPSFESDECSICYEPLDAARNTFALKPCGHQLCHDCLFRWLCKERKKACPMCRCRVIGICFPPMLLKIIDWGLKKTQRLREGYKRGLTKRLNDSLNRPEPLIRPTSHLELAKFAAVIRKSCAHAFASSLAHQISAFLSIEAPSPEQIKLYTVYFRLALYHPTIESIDECWDKHIKEVEAEIKKQKKMVRWPSQVKKAFHRLERSVNHLVDDWMEWRAMRKEARSLGAPPQPPI